MSAWLREISTPFAEIRSFGGRMALFVSLVALALFVAGCGPGPDNEPAEIPAPQTDFEEATVTVGSGQLSVEVLRSAADRRTAASRTAFGTAEANPKGLLYLFPEGEVPKLALERVPVRTQVAYLAEDGTVIELEDLPASPQDVENPGRPTAGPNRIAPGETRFILQGPANIFTEVSLSIGQSVGLPQTVRAARDGEPVQGERAVYDLFYRPEGARGQQAFKTKRFSLEIVATATDRNEWLTAEAIDGLGESEGLLVYFPEAREIHLSVRDIAVERPFFLLPFTGDPSSASPAGAVEIRPYERRAANEPGPNERWMQQTALRNWEYRSADEYRGFVLLPGVAVDALGMARVRTPTRIYDFRPVDTQDTPFAQMNAPALPTAERLPEVVTARIENREGTVVAPRLKVLSDHQARLLGLQGSAPLRMPTGGQDGTGDNGSSDENDSDGFDPAARPNRPTAHEGYLLRFPHTARRPLFTGSLPTAGGDAPYDVAMLNAAGEIREIVRIANDRQFYPANESIPNRAYHSLWIMPRGWFEANGMVVPASENRSARLIDNPLQIPAGLRIFSPEPARYPILVGGQRLEVEVEIANAEMERNRGLMWRRELESNNGMLFLFRNSSSNGFYMLNCFIDLSVAYIRADGQIVTLVDMFHPVLPPWEETVDRDVTRPDSSSEINRESNDNYQPNERYRYVLEMPYGWYRQHGIDEGERIEISGVIGNFLTLAE